MALPRLGLVLHLMQYVVNNLFGLYCGLLKI